MFKINLVVMSLVLVVSSCSVSEQEGVATIQSVRSANTDSSVEFNQVKAGSFIDWRATHAGGVEPRAGKVFCKDVAVLVEDGVVASLSSVIDMNTLTVDGPAGLVDHLKNSDFLDIEKYTVSKFESTRIVSTQGDYNYIVTGDLTILDVPVSVTFKANINVSEKGVSIKSEGFEVDRTDWGMMYGAEGTEDYSISNQVGFMIDITVLP